MNTSGSILPNIESSGLPSLPASSSGEIVARARKASGSVFSSTWFKVTVIVLLLAILGFNIFSKLGNVTDSVQKALSPYVKPLASAVANTVGDTARQTIAVSAKGASAAINKTADVATSGIKQVQTAIDDRAVSDVTSSKPSMPIVTKPVERQSRHATPETNRPVRGRPVVSPDSSSSTVQGRSGYCYVGMYGGVRSCAEVNSSTECMSGDIFPTMDVCINPNLRA